MRSFLAVLCVFLTLGSLAQIDTAIIRTNGHIDQVVPYGDKLYLGGSFSMVGYQNSKVAVFDSSGLLSARVNLKIYHIFDALYDSATNKFFVAGMYSDSLGVVRNGVFCIDRNGNFVYSWVPKLFSGFYTFALYGSKLFLYKDSVLLAYDKFTGAQIGPSVVLSGIVTSNGTYKISGEANSIYVLGDFNTANGLTRKHYVKIDTSTLSVNPWVSPITAVNSNMNGLHVYKGKAYMWGAKNNTVVIYAVDTGITLTVDTLFPKVHNGTVQGIYVWNDSLYVWGYFDSIQGYTRHNFYQVNINTKLVGSDYLNLSSGLSVRTIKDTTIYLRATDEFGHQVTMLKGLGSGADLLAGLTPCGVIYDHKSDSKGTTLVGDFLMASATKANGLIALDPNTYRVLSWNPQLNGNVFKVIPRGAYVYVCGDFTSVKGVSRKYLAQIDTTTGQATSWNPNPSQPVLDISIADSVLFAIGGSTYGGVKRKIACIRLSDGTLTSWNPAFPDTNVQSGIFADSTGQRIYVAHNFTADSVNGQFKPGWIHVFKSSNGLLDTALLPHDYSIDYPWGFNYPFHQKRTTFKHFGRKVYVGCGITRTSDSFIKTNLVMIDSLYKVKTNLPYVTDTDTGFYSTGINDMVEHNGIIYLSGKVKSWSYSNLVAMNADSPNWVVDYPEFYPDWREPIGGYGIGISKNYLLTAIGSGLYRMQRVTGINQISGRVFLDLDSNGIKGAAEPLLSRVKIQLKKGASIISQTSSQDSKYFFYTDTGTYEVSAHEIFGRYYSNYCKIAPAKHTIHFNGSFMNDSLNDFAVRIDSLRDLIVNITGNRALSGFSNPIWMHLENFSSGVEQGRIILDFDNRVIPQVTLGPKDSLLGNRLIITCDSLTPLGVFFKTLRFFVPASVALNTKLMFTCYIDRFPADSFPKNNYDTLEVIVSGSFDPNEKTVEPTVVSGTLPTSTKQFTYTIYFQNTGTDTAYKVVIKDSLDADLDLETFQVTGSSHAYGYTLDEGVVNFTFNNILLPDSHVNELASHGFIQYNIEPKPNPKQGTQLKNTAYIYFDFNYPIVTNTTLSVLQDIQPSGIKTIASNRVAVYPNPFTGRTTIETDNALLQPEISVYDIMGHLIGGATQVSSTHFELNGSSWPKGVYILKIRDAQTEFRTVQRIMLR